MNKYLYIEITEYIKYSAKHNHPTGIQRISKSLIIKSNNRDDIQFIFFFLGNLYLISNKMKQKKMVVIESLIKATKWKNKIGLLKNLYLLILSFKILHLKINKSISRFVPAGNEIILLYDVIKYGAKLKLLTQIKKQHKIQIACCLQDIIPLEREDLSSKKSKIIMMSFIKWANENADYLIYSSRYVYESVKRKRLFESKNIQEVINLPYEFVITSEHKTNLDLSNKLEKLFRRKYVLCVGTITDRKNQDFLINSWISISKRLPLPLLVLVGKIDNNIFDKSKFDPSFFVHLSDISDSHLELIYKNCLFSIFPSLSEGWGFPVSESIWFKKLCLVSNQTSLKEVGSDYVEYFDPTIDGDFEEKLLDILINEKYENFSKRVDLNSLTTWENYIDSLRSILM